MREVFGNLFLNIENSIKLLTGKEDNIILLLILSVILLFAFIILYIRTKLLFTKKEVELLTIKKLVRGIAPVKTLEENLAGILDVLSPLVIAEKLSFYLKDPLNSIYILKSSKIFFDSEIEDDVPLAFQHNKNNIESNNYKPPLSININEVSQNVGIYKIGGIPILSVPLKGGKGLIRIAPIRKITKNIKSTMAVISRELGAILDIISENEVLKIQARTAVNSAKATENISHIILDYKKMLENMIWISINALNADGAMYLNGDIEKKGLTFISDSSYIVEDNRIIQQLYSNLCNTIDNKNVYTIRNTDNDFSNFISLIKNNDTKTLLVVRLMDSNNVGLIVFWFKDDQYIEEYKVKAVLMLKKRMEEIIYTHNNSQILKLSYINMLKLLAQMMDNLSPYSVGYSEMMARYSTIIAKELKLSVTEIKNIALAAYLSNIGILGLSKQLFLKKDKYAALEYETMKLHAEVGASIIEATLANTAVATYIREHHERIDGFGYPSGISGDNISMGARIIMVVQTFIAKIISRPERDPLAFNSALEMLKIASGNQLDKIIVNTLIGWFDEKRKLSQHLGKSLGSCWNMRCSSEDICSLCPAYEKLNEKNCWEYEKNNCLAHGNECETCFIRNEYFSRN